jgi:tetratricopeptide (TPR) repeat protein
VIPVRIAFLALILISGCATSSTPVETADSLTRLLREGEEAEWRGDWDGAGAAYGRAARDFGDHSESWSRLGEYRRFCLHDPAAAEAAFKRALEAPRTTETSIAFAWRGLGEVARGRGEIDRAIGCF